jgi:short subunit dehydrogenase-like uncharacterized protein
MLLAEEAVRRGHKPLLAGRSAEKLAPLAERLGLEWVAVDLRDAEKLREALGRVDLVLHAAGPFIHTSAPMVEACIAACVDYLDISGELPVLTHTFACNHEAHEQTVLLVSACGFDVLPTDSLAMHLASRLPDATELEIAVNVITKPTAGTLLSALEGAPTGGWIRRDGELVPLALGKGSRMQRFSNGRSLVMPLPLGDLETAYRSTGIPNITTYLAVPRGAPLLLRVLSPILRLLVRSRRIHAMIERAVRRLAPGPNEKERNEGRSYLWGRARNANGEVVEEWMETLEGYRFTQIAAVRAAEEALEHKRAGALSPAQAFGPDFVATIEGTRILGRIEEMG